MLKLNPFSQALIWLLGALSITFALHAMTLHIWVPSLFVLMAVWRFCIEKFALNYPPLWIRLPLTIAGGVGVLITYGSLFGRDASMALFAVMIAVKLLETKSPRDYVVMVILGYFLTVNVLLFTQAIWVFFVLLLPIIALTACLIAVSHPNTLVPWRTQTQIAGKMLLQSVPIMLVLFILFPRIPGPIWGIPRDAYSGMTGLSDNMSPGDISDLSLSSKVAFRAEFKGAIPANNQLYWRGPVLWHQEGRTWRATSEKLNLPQEDLVIRGEDTAYTVTLEPHNRNWLLMLDMPTNLPPNAKVTHDLQIHASQPIRTRIRYEAISNLQYALATSISDYERTLALQLLEDENPKTRALAAKWSQTYQNPQDIVNAALKMFRDQPFVYTLAPPTLGQEPVDDFLFNTKRGFCEHYASSFTYLMRAAGIPARIVTGYQGGEINPNGNYLIVRQSDAHAWAEVWLEGRGWVRIDPTSAVSPNRIESGVAQGLSDANLLPLFARQDFPLLKKLYLNWDMVNNGWNQWVLSYDQEKQLKLLRTLISQKIEWHDIGLIFVLTTIFLMSIVSYLLLKNGKLDIPISKRYYLRFLNRLAKLDIHKAPDEGVYSFGMRASQILPNYAHEITHISTLYNAFLYAKPSTNDDETKKRRLTALATAIKRFKPKKASA
jgi:protein-glutamine gamma-glutamyltransferase